MRRDKSGDRRVLLLLNRRDSELEKQIFARLKGWQFDIYTDWTKALAHSQQYLLGLFYLDDSKPEEEARTLRVQLESLLSRVSWTSWVGLATARQMQQSDFRQLIKRYCCDYFTCPLDNAPGICIQTVLGHAYGMAALNKQIDTQTFVDRPAGLIGDSAPIRKLLKDIRKVARANAPVLISGESGTGKELIARAIHRDDSRRSGHPFVVVNCGAIPAMLLESELFGHVRGAFTGADKNKTGRIEAADGGTLFLDEIGDLPIAQQVKLLRFLQEGTIDPVGSLQSRKVDVRVLAASHIKLEEAVLAGDFREDLFFRLNVLQLHSPRLADRKADIEQLAYHYLNLFRLSSSSVARDFSRDALRAMAIHSWPGNVRELMNRVQKALVMSEFKLITPEDLGLTLPHSQTATEIVDLESVRNLAEKQALQVRLKMRTVMFQRQPEVWVCRV